MVRIGPKWYRGARTRAEELVDNFSSLGTLVLLAGKWFENPWLPAIVFAALTTAAMGGYFASLDPLSRLAEEKKELLIETLCR